MTFKRKYRILVIICFLIGIWAPFILMDKVGGKVSESENRTLAKFPAIFTEEGTLAGGIRTGLENWINDNIGFRKSFLKLNSYIDYYGFRVSPKSDTLIGKDKWLFYYHSGILKDFQHKNLPNLGEIERYSSRFIAFQQFFSRRNIPFIYTLLPDKKTIYPENYPDSIIQIGDVSKSDMITNDMQKKSNAPFLYLKEELLSNKGLGTLYSPRLDNAHWNAYGAFIGYRALMEEIVNILPEISLKPLEAFGITAFEKAGYFNKNIPISETSYLVKSTFESQIVGKDNAFYSNFPDLSFANNPSTYSHRYINQDTSLPKAILIGDSYALVAFMELLAEEFSELTYVHITDADKIIPLVEMIQPDIVIYEVAERMLDTSMEALDKFYAADLLSSPEITFDSLLSKEIRAAGGQPYHYLDYVQDSAVSSGVAMIDPESTVTVLAGWAVDPLAGQCASGVFIEYGGEVIQADYGQPRDTVAIALDSPSYLQSGYHAALDTAKLLEAGSFTVHVIGADGIYRLEPQPYKVVPLAE